MAKKKPASRPPTRKPKTELLPKGYETFLRELKERIRTAQVQAATAVNRVLIELDWHIGASIAERQKTLGWGKSVVERLARDLQTEFPGMSGFSPRNVWRMRALLSGIHRGGHKTATARGRNGRRDSATGRGRNTLGAQLRPPRCKLHHEACGVAPTRVSRELTEPRRVAGRTQR